MQKPSIKRTSIYILLIFTLIFSKCENKIENMLDCRIGETYKVTRALSFTIDSLNDSRCPENVFCFWAGKVHLFVNIDLGNKNIDTIFYEDTDGRNPYILDDYSFSVLEVKPIVSVTTTSKDITIKMFVRRN